MVCGPSVHGMYRWMSKKKRSQKTCRNSGNPSLLRLARLAEKKRRWRTIGNGQKPLGKWRFRSMARSMWIRVANGSLTNSLWQPLKTIGKIKVSDVPSRRKQTCHGGIAAPLTDYWESQKTISKTSFLTGSHELFTRSRQDQDDELSEIMENH